MFASIFVNARFSILIRHALNQCAAQNVMPFSFSEEMQTYLQNAEGAVSRPVELETRSLFVDPLERNIVFHIVKRRRLFR